MILFFNAGSGQSVTHISGRIIDETGTAINNAVIHYGKSLTTYTDKEGQFVVPYQNPQRFWYFLYIESVGHLPPWYHHK